MSDKLKKLEAENYWEPSPTKTTETEERLSRVQQLSDEFEQLLEETRRTIPGAEGFMRPQPFKQLHEALGGRTVVILIPGEKQCEALILNTPIRGVDHVRLSGVSIMGIRRLALATQNQQQRASQFADMEPQGRPEIAGRAGTAKGKGGLDDVLRRLWTDIVKPIIDHLGFKNIEQESQSACNLSQDAHKLRRRNRPRLWWCPVGEAVFLPLHAAGSYKGKAQECISDYVVSSYLPNLNTLTNARGAETPLLKTESKLLLLSQPRARRQRRLQNTAEEVARVANLFAQPDSLLYMKGSMNAVDTEGRHTTMENVLTVLPEASILHMACHGYQDPDDPLQSGFEMLDDRLTVHKLMKLKIPRAFFAFLSACQSASGSEELPDEAVGLASTMLFLGFRSVVGTMW